MPSRKKGGQRLLELARKRRQKAAKDKADKLAPMVIEPTLSKLRTGKGRARGKGGSALMALSKLPRRAARSIAAAKAKKPRVSEQVKRNVAAGSKPRPKAKAKASPRKSAVPPSLPKRMEIGKAKPKGISKKDQKRMEDAMKLGAGGAATGIGIKLFQLGRRAHAAHKLKKAEDARRAAAKAKRAADAAKKAEEAKKGVSGIGQARAASAASRTSGLGKAKPKAKRKKTSKSAFEKTPKKKTQRRYPK